MQAPDAPQYTSIGGQAVIEGVMMRSPHFVSIAVRKPDRKIVIKSFPYQSFLDRVPFFKKPILRGVVTLLESMFQGIDALSYSASVAGKSEVDEELSSAAIAGSIFSAFVAAILLFVALPHLITVLITRGSTGITANSPVFHLIDGSIKMTILLAYVYLIALMPDIRRVFQYHGAEHKSIYTFETNEDLSVAHARAKSPLHPRCGTSFLLFLVLISIGVFSLVFPLFGLTHFSENPILNHTAMVGVKALLMMPVAGLAYEFIKACAFRMDHPIFKLMIMPGLTLQRLTTREPEDDQLEVALASLKQVLRLEKGVPLSGQEEIEIAHLNELGTVHATVSEFPEG